MRIVVLNPLPVALAHYEHALVEALTSSGLDVVVEPTTPIEVAGGSRTAKARAAVRAVAERVASGPRTADHLLVLWPAFGYLDRLLWTAGSRVTLVLHDPSALRRQFGLSEHSSRIARVGRARVLVHSDRARDDVLSRGIEVAGVLPLPMLEPRISTGSITDLPGGRACRDPRPVTVLGQHKSARDLALLEQLAPLLRERGLQPRVRGRGWPPVAGWDVVDGFLDEAAFDDAITGSAALLLPYAKVFQSDVAVRAAELGVPVVGPQESNVPDLFGPAWPGTVPPDADPAAWARAVVDVAALDAAAVHERTTAAWRGVRDAWTTWAASL